MIDLRALFKQFAADTNAVATLERKQQWLR